jgi:uncharacterized lipoprotein NlpE involved in copper resistance
MNIGRAWRSWIVVILVLMLAGCNTWSTSNVELKTNTSDLKTASLPETVNQPAKLASEIVVTEKDITNRKYKVLGDIEVTVNKTTIFHADPTKALVNEKLKDEAAKLNADAVILVRYGSVGIGLLSWGSLDGRGRAVEFIN